MSVQQFLAAVLPTQGYRFGIVHFGKQGDAGFRPSQKLFEISQTDDLIGFGVWGSSKGGNAYFAVGGFQMTLDPTTGKPQRLASNAVFHRCLRADIDVGPGKPYATKQDALQQLVNMVAHYGMPAPWIVDSGGGIHVYWAFDRDVTLAEWIPLSGRLAAAFESFGLHVDTTTTLDAARILRLPGTLNNKPEYDPKPVVQILQVGHSVPPEQVVLSLPAAAINTSVPAALRGQPDELSANLHQPYFLRDLLNTCPGLNAMVGNGGRFAQEPLWKSALDLINKSDEPDDIKRKVARGISIGHPGFTEENFALKWHQVQQQDYHPPTCSRMAAAGMPECSSCPMRGKISSPLVLGRPGAPRAPSDSTVPPLPAPAADPPAAPLSPQPSPVTGVALAVAPPVQIGVFVLDHTTVVRVVDGRLTSRLSIADGYPVISMDVEDKANGGVMKRVNKQLLDNRILQVERMLDPTQKRSVCVLTFDRGRDGVVSIEFNNNDFAEPKSFYNKMNAEGVYCKRKDAADFLEKFMAEFLTQLQRARAASQIAGRCGWTEDMQAFVLGTQLFRNDGTVEHIRTALAQGGEMEGYHVAGNEDAWRRGFEIALSGGVDRQAVLALALAGPLMAFTGLDGVLLNAYSPESGIGKSTLCDAALSIWGSPNALRKDFRDTANATFKIASISGNMPMVIDEFTNVEGKALSDYVYTLTQGREKLRMTSDAKVHTSNARWCLVGIATSNNSVHEKLQAYRSDAVAEAARVFELRLHPLNLSMANVGQIKVDLMALRTSYGFLGPRLVQMFMAQTPDYWRQQVMARISKWDREASSSTGDRFRSATCALIEIGAALGKALGFAFDSEGIKAELAKHWTKQVAEFDAERKAPLDFINGYVLRHRGDFAVFGGTDGKQLVNANLPRRWMGEQRGKTVNGQNVATSVIIPLDPLREYVRDQNGNFKAVLEWMQQSPLTLRHGKLTFLGGTVHQMTTSAVELSIDAISTVSTLTIVPTEAHHETQVQR